MRTSLLCGICLLLAYSPAYAKPIPESLTLAQAQAIALENHPQIQAGDLKVKAAKQNVKVARSGYLPQLNGNALRVAADDNTRLLAGPGINNPTILDRGAYGVSLSQLITDFGRTSDLIDASKLQVEAQKSRAELTRQMVVLNVTRAYYSVLRAQALVKVAKSTQKARKAFLEQVTSLQKERMKSNLDTNLAQQGVQEAGLLALQARNALDDAQTSLSEALGFGDSLTITLADEGVITPYPTDIQPLLDRAVEKNPEVKALRGEWEATRKKANADEKAEYPTLSALGYAGDSPFYNSAAPVKRSYATAGLNLSIPLYSGGRISAEAKRTSYQADAARQELDARMHVLSRDVRAAWNNTRTAYENIEVSKNLLNNSRETLELMQARYGLGKSSIVELAQAQLNATTAEISAANARYEYFLQRALLDFATGSSQ